MLYGHSIRRPLSFQIMLNFKVFYAYLLGLIFGQNLITPCLALKERFRSWNVLNFFLFQNET